MTKLKEKELNEGVNEGNIANMVCTPPHTGRGTDPDGEGGKTADLINALNRLLDNGEVNQTIIAKNIGYSAAAVNTFLKGNYKGDLKKIETALNKFLITFEESKKSKVLRRQSLDFVETSISKALFKAASLCQFNGEIGVCFGSSGLGKTTAIKEYMNTKSGVITVDPDENTSPRAVLKQIANRLKVPESQYMETFVENIVKRLYGAGNIIIIDEAENLNAKMFRVLRKIHDRCDGTLGLLFVGTEVLYGNLIKLKGEYDYVVNRIACCAKLDDLKDFDLKKMIEQFFPFADEKLIRYMIAITNRNARILFNTLKRASDIVTSSGENLSPEIIKTAREYLLVGISKEGF